MPRSDAVSARSPVPVSLFFRDTFRYNKAAASRPEPTRHIIFYAKCQAMFYLICFRKTHFRDQPDGLNFLRYVRSLKPLPRLPVTACHVALCAIAGTGHISAFLLPLAP